MNVVANIIYIYINSLFLILANSSIFIHLHICTYALFVQHHAKSFHFLSLLLERLQTSTIQEKYNSNHIRNFKFSSRNIKN